MATASTRPAAAAAAGAGPAKGHPLTSMRSSADSVEGSIGDNNSIGYYSNDPNNPDNLSSDDEEEQDTTDYFVENEPVNKVYLHRQFLEDNTRVMYSSIFSASPGIIHFSGLTAGTESTQVLSIINRSSSSQRLIILPPSTEYFSIDYEKRGLLAAGMAQKIVVKFRPTEFKYYYDAIKIRSEVDNLLIPIHGYPIINKIDFPSKLSFGCTPLCEPVSRVRKLFALVCVSVIWMLNAYRELGSSVRFQLISHFGLKSRSRTRI
jgi:hypothetical protein